MPEELLLSACSDVYNDVVILRLHLTPIVFFHQLGYEIN